MPSSRNACTDVAPWRFERRALVGAQDHRDVGEDRQRVAERLVAEDLLRRVREVVVAADDVGDLHASRRRRPRRSCRSACRRCGRGSSRRAAAWSKATSPWIEVVHDRLPWRRGSRSRSACGRTRARRQSRQRAVVAEGLPARLGAPRAARRAAPACSGSGRRGPRRAAARRGRGRCRSARSGG